MLTPMTQTLTFDTLVDAYFDAAEYATYHDDVSSYFALRRDILASMFGCSLEPRRGSEGEDAHDAFDRKMVSALPGACLEGGTRIFSPFGGRLEGSPGPIERALVTKYGAKFERTIATLKSLHRALFRDALLAAYPEAESKAFRAGSLIERGLPAVAPDLDDYL